MTEAEKSKFPKYLAYSVLGVVLTAALVAFPFIGGIPFAVIVSIGAAAAIHSLVDTGLDLYENYQKPHLSNYDKFKIGAALAITGIATLGLMITFPHIGIPLAAAVAISSLAFGISFISTIKNIHDFFSGKKPENMPPRDAMHLDEKEAEKLREEINSAFDDRHAMQLTKEEAKELREDIKSLTSAETDFKRAHPQSEAKPFLQNRGNLASFTSGAEIKKEIKKEEDDDEGEDEKKGPKPPHL